MPPKTSPLDFTHIPHRDGMFVHFDANTGTYLVQAFFKDESLSFIRSLPADPDHEDDIEVTVPLRYFDEARDAFIKKLFTSHGKKAEVHSR